MRNRLHRSYVNNNNNNGVHTFVARRK